MLKVMGLFAVSFVGLVPFQSESCQPRRGASGQSWTLQLIEMNHDCIVECSAQIESSAHIHAMPCNIFVNHDLQPCQPLPTNLKMLGT